MMLGLMMVWISVPVQAQNVIEDEGIETVDEEDVSDSTLVDSLAADTLAQKLPWPESVKVGMDRTPCRVWKQAVRAHCRSRTHVLLPYPALEESCPGHMMLGSKGLLFEIVTIAIILFQLFTII